MSGFNAFEKSIDFSLVRELCCNEGTLTRYRKGEHFATAGEIIKRVAWIKTGSFRHSLIDHDGTEKSVGFVFSGSMLANYISAVMKRPLPTSITAIEDSEVYEVAVSRFRELLFNDPTFSLTLAQGLFAQAYEIILDRYRNTPRQNYELLLSRCPKLFELVPLNEIASYLNISRRQLHRWRNCQE
jgi:CRP-like cAMP-binding protein